MGFNAELVNGSQADHERLAEEIAAFVEQDTTQPELPNNRDAWLSDLEIRNLERAAGHHKGNWAWLASICGLAAEFISGVEGKVLRLLEEFGGERRLADPDVQLLEGLRARIAAPLATCEEGPRKEVLDILFDSHVGVYARDVIGDYELAMGQQVKAALRAGRSGNIVSAAIAELCACVEHVNLAISSCENTEPFFRPLHLAAYKVAAICVGNDPTEIIWRCYNAPQHVFQAHIWALRKMAVTDEQFWRNLLFTVLPKADSGHYVKNFPTIESLEAGLLLLNNHREEAARIARKVAVMGADRARPIARMTARFILAVLAGDEHLRVISSEKGEMHQLRRLAEAVLQSRAKAFCFEHAEKSS